MIVVPPNKLQPPFLATPPLPPGYGEFRIAKEAKARTTPTEVAQVTVELCEMISSSSCSVCATSAIHELEDVIFDSYHIYNGRGQRFQKYSQRVMKCQASSQVFQVVKFAFNTNEIQPTEITIFGNGK